MVSRGIEGGGWVKLGKGMKRHKPPRLKQIRQRCHVQHRKKLICHKTIKRPIPHHRRNPHVVAHSPMESNSMVSQLVPGEARGNQSGPCLFILVYLVDALQLRVVAGLDPVQLLPLLLQLPLELVLLQLHRASLSGRPADPALQLQDPRLQGHHALVRENPARTLRAFSLPDAGTRAQSRRHAGGAGPLGQPCWTFPPGSPSQSDTPTS